MIRLVHGPLAPPALADAVTPADGASVTFEGFVRADAGPSTNSGPAPAPSRASHVPVARPTERRVTHLEYEAYEEMAEAVLTEIADEARRRFAVTAVHIAHRLGRVPVGEASVTIVVTAPHRAPAFEACRFVIDALKERAPIWKKELYEGGDAAWVEGTGLATPPAPDPAARRR